MTTFNFREWAKENKVDTYAFSRWLYKNFPGKHWKECNNPENRDLYLIERKEKQIKALR